MLSHRGGFNPFYLPQYGLTRVRTFLNAIAESKKKTKNSHPHLQISDLRHVDNTVQDSLLKALRMRALFRACAVLEFTICIPFLTRVVIYTPLTKINDESIEVAGESVERLRERV